MGFNRKQLYGKRIQLIEGLPGGMTYYVDSQAICLSGKNSEGNRHEYCSMPSGYGAEYEGTGRCKHHGAPLIGVLRSGGRYSQVAKGHLKKMYEQFTRDPDLLNLTPELNVQRTLLTVAWEKLQESYENEDIRQALIITNSIVQTVGKIEQIQSQQVLTTASARLMMVKAIETAKKLLADWFPDEDNTERLNQFMLTWRNDVENVENY